ncbi:unnamed protein product [Somion occarium]|uniref:DAGKc domain-containing protein n=1 Tax=Somion occarium TaxID=3059160 RepID=A0ABP1DC11_9APHY
MAEAFQQLVLDGDGQSSTFTLTGSTLQVQRPVGRKGPQIQFETPLRQVLWAELSEDNTFNVSFLNKKKKKKGSLSLIHITGPIKDNERENVADFVKALMDSSYQGVSQRRRLMLLVNPRSGPGKARSIYMKKIEPLFRAARCEVDLTYTTHSKHATELARSLAVGHYDAIVTMSGDGLIYEVLNGLAEHASPIQALQTPITPIPTGSGNGLAYNLLGLHEGGDVSAAALNAIKGKPMPIDLFSVTQNGQRTLSFMSQCIGLMAELDLGTEHLRFMGNHRFVYGFVRGIARNRACPVKLQIKVAESDKKAMFQSFKETRARAISNSSPQLVEDSTADGNSETNGNANAKDSTSLPSLRFHEEDPVNDEGWITFDKPVSYIYAGKGPFVSRDFMQFPVSLPNDGCIDVVVQEVAPRSQMLSAMDGAEKGIPYWKLESQHYFKAKAYRVVPHTSASCLSIDGEKYPFEPYALEVHPGLGALLSPYGTYHTDFDALS